MYGAFMMEILVISVNYSCSSGSTAFFLARSGVENGAAECALAFGFEEMSPGAPKSHRDGRGSPFDSFLSVLDKLDYPIAPLAARCFGAAGDYYLKKYDANPSLFAKVSVKTRNYAKNNPYALLNADLVEDQELLDKVLYIAYLTQAMCCQSTCGAAADYTS